MTHEHLRFDLLDSFQRDAHQDQHRSAADGQTAQTLEYNKFKNGAQNSCF